MKKEEKLDGLVEKWTYPVLGTFNYKINIDVKPFLKSLNERGTKAGEVVWQWENLNNALYLPVSMLAYLKTFYDGSEDFITESLNCKLRYSGEGGLEFGEGMQFSDEELKKKINGIDEAIKTAMANKVYASAMKEDKLAENYKFKPGYKWNKNVLEIYEDLEEKGEVMKLAEEIMEFNENRYKQEKK